MNNEIIWKDVILDGIVTNYEVSNTGLIRNKSNGNVLSNVIANNGYYVVNLHINNLQHTKTIHRLVANTFIPNPENKPQVNHINGNKLDNRVENLEWNTQLENIQHAFNNGLMPKGSEWSFSKYADDQIHLVCKLLEYQIPIRLITDLTGVKSSTIFDIRKGISWTHIGRLYKFDSNYYSTHDMKKIKYKDLKKILIELNIFNDIDLFILLKSKNIKKKKKLLEDLENEYNEIFLFKDELKELSKIENN